MFEDAVRRVALLSAERSKGVKFTLEKNRLRLFSSNPEIGEARDKIEVEYKGPDIEIGFNAQYFLDFLSVVDTEKIRFELKDENSAALLRPEGEEGLKSHVCSDADEDMTDGEIIHRFSGIYWINPEKVSLF